MAMGCLVVASCAGNVNDFKSNDGGSSERSAVLAPPPTQMPDVSPCTTPGTPGPRALRRLTNAQIKNTVSAVTADANAPGDAKLTEGTVLNFLADADFLTVSNTGAELLMNLGESLGTYAAAHPSTFAPCTSPDAACRKQVVDHIAAQFFHGTIPADRLAAYEAAAAAETDIPGVVQFMVAAAVQSPYFVYRRELGTAGKNNVYALNSDEIADEIAYQLTDGPPDAALKADATAGKLTDPAAVKSHVQRLLAQPTVLAHMQDFFVQWLELDKIDTTAAKVASVNLNLTDGMRADMIQQGRQLIGETWSTGGSVAQLMNSDHTFLNSNLAATYGMNGGNGNTFTAVPLANTGRVGGLLFEGAFLASHAAPDHDSPVQRGASVLRRVLCQTIPPPPAGVPAIPAVTTAPTTRALYANHAAAACASCHDRLDGVGFLFENYDAAGRYRTQENGNPVDSSGTLMLPSGNKAMDGNQLPSALAALPDVSDCMARFWTYETFGRAQWQQNGCTIDAVKAAGNGSLPGTAAALFSVPNIFSRTQK